MEMGLLIFVFGLIIGSLINCFVYRLNETNLKSFLIGRSYCPQCKKKLRWYDNIPLISFVLLKGRCRFCHKQISIHYPLVEFVCGLVSVVVYFTFKGNLEVLLLNLVISYVLIALFVSDLRYMTVPDHLTYPAIFFLFLFLLIKGEWHAILSGLGVALFFYILILITRFKGMGLGDIKLGLLIGLFLGFPKTIVALYLAFLTGAILGVILVLTRKKRFKSKIPFGPFLVLATFISLFFGEKIWQLFW